MIGWPDAPPARKTGGFLVIVRSRPIAPQIPPENPLRD
jgi:hypothetical protein